MTKKTDSPARLRAGNTYNLSASDIAARAEDNYSRAGLFTFDGEPCSYDIPGPIDPGVVAGLHGDDINESRVIEVLLEYDPAAKDELESELAAKVDRREEILRAYAWAAVDRNTALDYVLAKICGPDLADLADEPAAPPLLAGPHSIIKVGQSEEVTIYQRGTEIGLARGFRRWLSFLICERLGITIPVQFRGQLVWDRPECSKLRCKVSAAKDGDHAGLLTSNILENDKKERSPIDNAYLARRLIAPYPEGFALNRHAAARRLGVAKTTLDKLIQLTLMDRSRQLAVHRGELKPTAALKKQSEEGRAGHTGARKGFGRKETRKGIAYLRAVLTGQAEHSRIDANTTFTLAEVVELLRVQVGEIEAPDGESELVIELHDIMIDTPAIPDREPPPQPEAPEATSAAAPGRPKAPRKVTRKGPPSTWSSED